MFEFEDNVHLVTVAIRERERERETDRLNDIPSLVSIEIIDSNET
jgi:hypothetical protein